ncbi:ParB/RepB/Spo0J family partition protein [Thermomicrobium sp.]
MARRSGLGRGLDALIPRTTVDPDAIREIALDDIAPNPRQPRQYFSEESLQELAESIRTHGIIQPLVVTYNGGQPPYQLVAGERRWRAARLAGLTTVPALVRDLSPKDAVEIALIENLQRADLSPLETATAYRTLIHEFGLTQAEVAARVGKSRSAIANTLRLLEAPEAIQRALAMGDITEGHARALLSLPDTASQLAALQEIRQRSLTVRQTEELVRRWVGEKKSPRRTSPRLAPEIEHVIDVLRSRLRTKVELRTSARGGRLIIHYHSAEELARLLDELLRQSHDDHLAELG